MDSTFIFDNDVAIGEYGENGEGDAFDHEIISNPTDVREAISQEIHSIEFIDEFNGPDNFNLCGIPVLHIDDTNVQIRSFLAVPETPVRKGIKNSEHRSFIISSTPYQKEVENKLNKKIVAETEKENRMKERKIKKEKRDQEALLRQKRKTERMDCKLRKKPKPLKKIAISKNSSAKLREVFQNITKNDQSTEVQQISNEANDVTNECHVRKLFLDEYDVNVTCGICFKCAGHITSSKLGVSCNLCKYRKYHMDYAGTNINNKFICPACTPNLLFKTETM